MFFPFRKMGDSRHILLNIVRSRPNSYNLPSGCAINKVRIEVRKKCFEQVRPIKYENIYDRFMTDL